MSKGKALTPKLRFPEFRDAAGWEERQVGDFLSESRLPGSKGNVAKKITVKLWGNGVFEKNEAVQGSINTQYFRRKSGQFIYSKLDFLNQAFGIIPPSLSNFESTVDLPCFDIADGLNSVFLLEYVKRKDFYERLGETADGSRKARRIHAETFLSFSITLPTLSEQQKIAECLSSVDELIAVQARKLDALKTHKKGLMQQLFPREGETQPRLRFPEFQNAGEWERHTLGNVAAISKGKGIAKADVVENGTTPCIRYAELYTFYGEIISEVRSRTNIPVDNLILSETGDVIVPASGETKEDIATCACVLDAGVALGSDLNVLRSSIDGRFFSYYLNGCKRAALARVAQGDTVAHLYPSQISKLEINCPSNLPEQQRIADCLTSLDDLLKAQTQKLDALKTHKKGLMQQLFPSPEAVEA
jgi:type I restriction enzyme S subunit